MQEQPSRIDESQREYSSFNEGTTEQVQEEANPRSFLKMHGDKWAADLGIVTHRTHVPGSTKPVFVLDVFPVFRPLFASNSHNYKQSYDLLASEEANARAY